MKVCCVSLLKRRPHPSSPHLQHVAFWGLNYQLVTNPLEDRPQPQYAHVNACVHQGSVKAVVIHDRRNQVGPSS